MRLWLHSHGTKAVQKQACSNKNNNNEKIQGISTTRLHGMRHDVPAHDMQALRSGIQLGIFVTVVLRHE